MQQIRSDARDDADSDDPPFFSMKRDLASTNAAAGYRPSNDAALDTGMDLSPSRNLRRRLPDLGLALKTILAFWIFYFAIVTLRGTLLQYPDQLEMLQRRCGVTTVGAVLTFGVYLAMQPAALSSLRTKAITATLICFPAAFAFAAFNHWAFYIYSPLEASWAKWDSAEKSYSAFENAVMMIADGGISWYFFFAAWAALYVAMSYAAQLRAADNRAAAFAREAQEAQLRALRYQINPHFLFNTLNSLSSLILSQRTDVAERMIMNLSTFFRTTLSADPTADISLEEEIRLQRLYLDIEQVRFPDRLRVEVDIPANLRTVRVPILILQPIVENAIKYGVARSKRPVRVAIRAHEEAGRLHLKVKDDGDAPPPPEGDCDSTGVGLRNVCDRLIARFGLQAGCFHGADPSGGYTVHVVMPVVRNA